MSGATQIPSDEADENQLEMASAEGAAYQRSLHYMVDEVADNGAIRDSGDYRIGIAQERAEGMYHLIKGKLMWHEAGEKENCHFEVSVSDVADHRFIPYLNISATLVAADGQVTGPFKVPFVWHPGLYHYGTNIVLPGAGRYAVTVQIEPPGFMRHDKVNGARYGQAVEVTFEDFEITTGRE